MILKIGARNMPDEVEMNEPNAVEEILSIRFVKHHSPYNVDDVAGFPKSRAEAIMKAGKAVPMGAPGWPAPPRWKGRKAGAA
jgi:hypothetical protein